MDNFVITIARQYGSGGRTVGEMLAKKLGIGYYDKDIIRIASEYTSARRPLFGKKGIYSGELIPPQSKDFTSDENLFNYQAKVIRELAEKESCVIIGRCANFVLKDYPNVLRVFVHANWDFRMEKAAEKLSMSTREIEKFLQRDDRRKDEYYRRFTGQEWKDATQYDLCLDSSKLGYDKCIEEIENQLNMLKNK